MTLFVLFFGSPLDKECIKCSCVCGISEKKLREQTNYVTAYCKNLPLVTLLPHQPQSVFRGLELSELKM